MPCIAAAAARVAFANSCQFDAYVGFDRVSRSSACALHTTFSPTMTLHIFSQCHCEHVAKDKHALNASLAQLEALLSVAGHLIKTVLCSGCGSCGLLLWYTQPCSMMQQQQVQVQVQVQAQVVLSRCLKTPRSCGSTSSWLMLLGGRQTRSLHMRKCLSLMKTQTACE